MEDDYGDVRMEEAPMGRLVFDDEDPELSEFDDRWCLVGRFLTKRDIDFQAMQNKMFYHEVDIERVIERSPWTFDRAPLIFVRVKHGENPRLLVLEKLDLWVQIHDMTSKFMFEKVIKDVGNYIGSFVKSDPNNFQGVWRNYFRIRVSVLVDLPLHRNMKLEMRSGASCIVNFKYEDLPTFCFICRILGHSERFCDRLFDTPMHLIEKPYNLDLKAHPRRRHHNIGAQWLRTSPVANYGDHGINIPDFRDFSAGVLGGHNVQGISGGNGSDLERLKGALNVPSIYRDSFQLADSKKRKTTLLEGPLGSIGSASKESISIGPNEIENNVVVNNERNQFNVLGTGDVALGSKGDALPLMASLLGGSRGYTGNVTGAEDNIHGSFLESLQEGVILSNLEYSSSDHSPIYLEPIIRSNHIPYHQFRFENAWLKEPMCIQIVKDSWEAHGEESVMGKINLCATNLSRWGKDLTGNFKRRIQQCKNELSVLKNKRDAQSCVSSAKYTIVHGPHEMCLLLPSRGIHQGDPLSPYLFILCAEGLSVVLRKYEHSGWIHGCKAANGALRVSHMLFADDSYLYCKATVTEAVHIPNLFHSFELASGQQVNLAKSSIFFSTNTDSMMKQQLCTLLQMQEAAEGSFYLGLPSAMSRNNLDISNDIERAMTKFWWRSSKSDGKGIHWMSWDKLCKHKRGGGMGFRDLRDFNLALLGKQGWRLLTRPSSLVSRIFKARYYVDGNFLNAQLGSNPSFIWRSIVEAQDLVRWEAVGWDLEIIADLFEARDQSLIRGIPLSDTAASDHLFWSFENSCEYSVKSAYNSLQKQKSNWFDEEIAAFWSKLWKLKLPSKVSNLLWRACTQCLRTLVQLKTKRVDVNLLCPICLEEDESVLHYLVTCRVVKLCWNRVGIGTMVTPGSGFLDWCWGVFQHATSDQLCLMATVCWAVWGARNDLVWNGKAVIPDNIIEFAKKYLDKWKNARQSDSDTSYSPFQAGDGNEHWCPPHSDCIKINVDATLFERNQSYGFGLVARDSNSLLIEGRTALVYGVVEPVLAEVLGIKEALSWIKEAQWQNVTLESDCLWAVQGIRSSLDMFSTFGLIVKDCKSLLASLTNVSISFVKRSTNLVAHNFAKAAILFPDRRFSLEHVPTDLLPCELANGLGKAIVCWRICVIGVWAGWWIWCGLSGADLAMEGLRVWGTLVHSLLYEQLFIGFAYSFHVNYSGKSGGLILIRNDDWDVEVKSFTKGHIDALVKCPDMDLWQFTRFYGHHLKAHLQGESWRLLSKLKDMLALP
uniref:Reverse transcriptase n=1 Tax=Cannabis sativa TaxID=3483 RepID=A0A803QEG5_CANSA